MLSDPAKRADYDAGGSVAPNGLTTEDLLGGIDLGDLLDAGVDLGRAFFGRLFNGPNGGGGLRSRGSDVQAEVEVP